MTAEPLALEPTGALPGTDDPPGPPVRILALEDDPVMLDQLDGYARPRGVELHAADDPTRFVALLELVRPDVVLLDAAMADVDVLELCRGLKRKRHTRVVPVVVLVEREDVSGRRGALEAGCDTVIAKPVQLHEVDHEVHALAAQRRLNEQLDDAESVIEGIAHVVEARDPNTGDHCDRLARRVGRFGRWLGLGPAECVALERAGVLHDIGKIAVPDAVLLKPGKLDEAEWEIMRRHPVVGAELLERMASMRLVVPIVRHHHERWDGGGYPDGLEGPQIPSLARIFQIVDAFDALTSVRPYKPAMTSAEALVVLEGEASTGKWDPRVVASFVRFLVEDGIDVDEAVAPPDGPGSPGATPA